MANTDSIKSEHRKAEVAEEVLLSCDSDSSDSGDALADSTTESEGLLIELRSLDNVDKDPTGDKQRRFRRCWATAARNGASKTELDDAESEQS